MGKYSYVYRGEVAPEDKGVLWVHHEVFNDVSSPLVAEVYNGGSWSELTVSSNGSGSGGSGEDEVSAKSFLKISSQLDSIPQFDGTALNWHPLSKSAFAELLGVTELDIDNLLSGKTIGIQVHTDVVGSESEPINEDDILYLVSKNYPQSSCTGYSDTQICYCYRDLFDNNSFEFWTDGTKFAAERWESGLH